MECDGNQTDRVYIYTNYILLQTEKKNKYKPNNIAYPFILQIIETRQSIK